MYLLSQLGPRAASDEELERKEVISNPELENLRIEVTRLQVKFDALIDDHPPTAEDLEVLQLAIAKQRQILNAAEARYPPASDLEVMENLEARYASYAGGVLHAESVAAETAGNVAEEEGRRDDAITHFRRALALQEEINLRHARGKHLDRRRIIQLQLRLENLQAEPLDREARELAQEARLNLEKGNTALATTQYRRALALNASILRDYPSSRFADRRLERELASALVNVEAADLYRRREQLREEGRAAAAAGRLTEALDRIEAAVGVQQEILSRFPESSYARKTVLDELERERQSALSSELHGRIVEKTAALEASLRARRSLAAGPLVAELYRDVRQLNDRFPLSDYLDEALLLRARFLNLRRDDIGTIQDSIYEQLRPLPGRAGRQMLRSEVTQVLYRLVMGSNPSSQAGDRHPVDSVDFGAAEEFCERLGWIMGFPVSLPEKADFDAAVGEVRLGEVAAQAWSSRNAERQTHPVGTREPNANGFFDLLGNVAEWLREPRAGDPREVLVVGGSVRDTPESLGRVPAEYVDRNERSRFTGFRVVVLLASPDGVE